MKFSDVKLLDEKNIMHTYNRFPISIESGKGCLAKDINGKEYIDFTSGIGVNCLGYCHERLVNALIRQASKVQHISNLYYNSIQVSMAEKICEVSGLDKVFLCNSGAEANEAAIKLARKYSSDKYNCKSRSEIITLLDSFHGRTITTLSGTGQDVFHKHFQPFTEGFKYAQPNDIESVKNTIDQNTCAIMIELIQGEGGVKPLNVDFVKEIAKICESQDLLLIVDEVQTGVSRTGSFFCFEQFQISPDIVTTAKGLGGGFPIGACLCNEKLSETLSPATHGSTFGGNPLACAVSLEVLDIVSKEDFLKSIQDKGLYFKSKLNEINGLSNVRGLGLMIGFETIGIGAKQLASCCVENGLLILTAKGSIRFLPPLNISYEDIDNGLSIFERSLNQCLNGGI